MASLALRTLSRAFVMDIGTATISGVVRELTAPVTRPVYLLEQEGLRVLRETRSAADGTYSFPNMEAGRQYMVLAIDSTGARSAVVSDRIEP
jgi:hypothetical protein